MCDHLNKEKQSKDADTNNKEERLTTKEVRCMMPHALASELRSQIPKCFRSLHTLLGLSLCVPNSLVVNALNLFIF